MDQPMMIPERPSLQNSQCSAFSVFGASPLCELSKQASLVSNSEFQPLQLEIEPMLLQKNWATEARRDEEKDDHDYLCKKFLVNSAAQ